MDPITLGLLTNVIWGPIAFGAGQLYQKRLAPGVHRATHSLRSILPFAWGANEQLTITYGYVMPAGQTQVLSIEQGDVLALLKAHELASTFWSPERIRIQDSNALLPDLLARRNVLSISGPKWNKVTEHYLGTLGCPVHFISNPRALACHAPGRELPALYETQGRRGAIAQVCHGLIVSGSVEAAGGERQNVVLCAGRTTLCTNACLLYLARLSRSPGLLDELRCGGAIASSRWAVIVRVENVGVQEGGLESPLLERHVRLKAVRIVSEAEFIPPYAEAYVSGRVFHATAPDTKS